MNRYFVEERGKYRHSLPIMDAGEVVLSTAQEGMVHALLSLSLMTKTVQGQVPLQKMRRCTQTNKKPRYKTFFNNVCLRDVQKMRTSHPVIKLTLTKFYALRQNGS